MNGSIPAVGVICEYNPFHNGHASHLAMIRRELGECVIICAMSGSFTQRGDVAILPPDLRARMALEGGADIVFEMPLAHTLKSAEGYACGGVSMLNALGVCDYISFGCEDTGLLWDAYNAGSPDVRRGLDAGLSYAKACGLPNMSNLILGVEYLRALDKLPGSSDEVGRMKPLPIRRDAGGNITSASNIRQLIADGDMDAAARFMPDAAFRLLCDNPERVRLTRNLDGLLLGMLRMSAPTLIRETPGISEGMENLIYKGAFRASTRDELILMVKSKRYTYTRISRALTLFMLGITKETEAMHIEPRYARLLGFRKSAQPLLRRIQNTSAIPIITKPANHRHDPLFTVDVMAASIAALASDRKSESMLTMVPHILSD